MKHEKEDAVNDYIALRVNGNPRGSLAQSAQPGAPVVDDHAGPGRRRLRASMAAVLRASASAERRWAERIDPALAR